ncbi:MAG: DUF2085 domain-containing protein [Anaerolineales bacterium]|nr:DUF2085 domain-containing protein [Anaerolineales bacterium]
MEATASISTPRWLAWGVIIAAITVIALWLLGTPAGVEGKADAVGYAICHRIPDRSFTTYDSRQLPLCARCTGIYTGVMTGFLLINLTGYGRASRLPSWRMGLVFVGFLAFFGIDGLNSYFHLFPNFEGGLYEPNNTLRLISGALIGLTMIHLLLPLFNMTVWRYLDERRALPNFRMLGVQLVTLALVVAAMLTGNPFVLLVTGLLSAFGVLMVLTMVNAVMFMTFIRRDRTYTNWGELWLPLLAGLTVALLLVGGIDAARYMFTGTWDGFIFAQR